MTNPLYPAFHDVNLSAFNRLLTEADEFDEKQSDEDVAPKEKKDPAQMTEDDVFSKVKQDNEQDVDTNAYSFLGREVDGSFSAINDLTNNSDPALKGLCNVVNGSIMKNSEEAVGYVTSLFDLTGVNDLSAEDFEKVKGTIWKKLEDVTALDPVESYSTFFTFVQNLVNGLRENRDIDGVA
jgi:hypothetical protein